MASRQHTWHRNAKHVSREVELQKRSYQGLPTGLAGSPDAWEACPYEQYWFYNGIWISGTSTDHLTAGGWSDLHDWDIFINVGFVCNSTTQTITRALTKRSWFWDALLSGRVLVRSSPHSGSASRKPSCTGRRRERWRRGKTLLLCH